LPHYPKRISACRSITLKSFRMPIRSKIQFSLSSTPITERVTKFGGQPVWAEAPQWPLSKETGNPMRFIGQIALDEAVFPKAAGKLAYIFMTDEQDYVDGTYEPDGGENAVIIQPGGAAPAVATRPLPTGPTLFDMVDEPAEKRLVAQEREYAVRLSNATEPAFVNENNRRDWSEDEFAKYAQALDGNKIGGSPIFLQADEFPAGGEWKLLLQLDSTEVPFSVNFGDAGIAYAFIDAAGTTGKLLWQCS
jgi:uncharacterized protein YwqG